MAFSVVEKTVAWSGHCVVASKVVTMVDARVATMVAWKAAW